jgi:hypothetical protein
MALIMTIRLRRLSTVFAAALALARGTPAAAQEVPPPPYPPLTGAEAEAVRDVVRQYQAAVDRGDGAAAARLVTAETREYFGRMRDLAVSASEAEVRAAPLVERINILMFRHRVPAGELRALAAAEAFAYTIENGWVDAMDGDEVADLGEVFGEGGRAVLRYGEDIPFVRENGAWRWDMMSVIRGVGAEIGADLESPEEENEFLMMVLRMSNGQTPTADIWQPLQ